MATFADVSHHQSGIDLAAYKRAGHDRIVLKATEGIGFTDSTFAGRWRTAGELGLARVAYHYARAKFHGADEFEHLWAVVRAAGGLGSRDRLCLDVEDTDSPDRAAVNAEQFGLRAVSRGVTRGLVYTGRWYANPNRITAGLFPAGWRQLWLSHYDARISDADILLPNGWSRDQLVARQYTDNAAVAGIPGPCDASRLLRDWLLAAPAVPHPTTRKAGTDMIVTAGKGSVLVVGDHAFTVANTDQLRALRDQGVPEVNLTGDVLGELGARVLSEIPRA